MQAPEAKKPGRRAFVPSDADRAAVRGMAGASHPDIALALGVSVPTLRKYFAADLAARAGDDLFAAEPATPAPTLRRPQRPPAGGRKPFRPDPSHRRRVQELAAFGKPPAAIARVIGVSEPTLRKHFAEDLAIGAEKVEAEIITALMTKARAGNVAALRAAGAMIAQARLDSLERELEKHGAAADKPLAAARADTPGKKLQAALEAAEVIESAPWAEHLRATH